MSKLEALLEALDRGAPRAEIHAALGQFKAAMPAHIAAEDQGLFPRLVSLFPERVHLVQQMVGQHHQIISVLDSLHRDAASASTGFPARVRAWVQMVREHVQVEDDVLFQGAEEFA